MLRSGDWLIHKGRSEAREQKTASLGLLLFICGMDRLREKRVFFTESRVDWYL